jgi:hypothetical protein
MRLLLACLSFVILTAIAKAASAFDAVRLLTPEQLQNLAVVAGRDGSPEPERWHVLVHDPKAESGLREVVVTDGKKTADRTLSQFAEALAATDVLGPDSVKVDSAQVGKIALQFGLANQLNVSALHYDLRKSGPEAAPLWTVTCLDANGSELGKIVVSASSGTVIMHPGFAEEPDLPSPVEARPSKIPNVGEREQSTKRIPSSSMPRRRAATPVPSTPKPGMFQRLFGGKKP